MAIAWLLPSSTNGKWIDHHGQSPVDERPHEEEIAPWAV